MGFSRCGRRGGVVRTVPDPDRAGGGAPANVVCSELRLVRFFGVLFPFSGQRGHGGRPASGHRDSVAVFQLRGLVAVEFYHSAVYPGQTGCAPPRCVA